MVSASRPISKHGDRQNDQALQRAGASSSPGLLHALIQRSAWKGYSPNFGCMILHTVAHESREDGSCGPWAGVLAVYMLWCWMDMQRGG